LLSLVCLAAGARIAPASENRSTRLRICMSVIQMLLTGWFTYLVFTIDENEIMLGYIFFATIFWYVMGVFMTCESPVMSERVKRSLPASFLGRMLFTWFNPGPGTGYMFATGNMLAVAILAVIIMLAAGTRSGVTFNEDVPWMALLACCYVIVYLGIVRLLISVARRVTYCGMLLGAMIHVLLLVGGMATALSVQWGIFYEFSYSPLQIPNPFWTLFKAAEGNIDIYTTPALPGIPIVPVVMVAAALAVLLANLFAVTGALSHVHAPTPERVIADELEFHPVPEAAPKPTNPWDLDNDGG